MKKPSNERNRAAALTLGALGVVYGDIGTSPLYTIRQCFGQAGGIAATEENVLGVLSLIFWSLFVVITLKYVLLIMRADNRGEGGIMALIALTRRGPKGKPRTRRLLLMAGLFGAALFLGDGVITPAISVLSAIEGLEIATPALKAYVVPLSLIVIVGLFLVQDRGTGAVGALFGPIICVWFVVLGALGLIEIVKVPKVLAAIDPRHAAMFAANHGWRAFVVLGSVVLAVTGGEALYADMGHFGRRAVRLAWFTLVLPGLLLNYFGQGALVILDPAAVRNPFYLLGPAELLYPMVALATAATVIASQAVITGAFSLSNQAIQLGYCPRLAVRHTSAQRIGQIYVPQVNWALLVAVLALVIGFESSDHLGAAYGLAVTGTMAMTTVLAGAAALGRWRWPQPLTFLAFGLFLAVDLIFFGATTLKLLEGGWVPLLIATGLYVLMSTWSQGRDALYARLRADRMSVEDFVDGLKPDSINRVAGTAVYLARIGDGVPHALLHNLKHNKVLHERVVLLTAVTEDIPVVAEDQRVDVVALPKRIYRVTVRYGFRETPDLPRALRHCAAKGLEFDMMETSFFVGRVTLVRAKKPRMARWRRRLYFALTSNALSVTDFFRIPPNRVVELGAQIEL